MRRISCAPIPVIALAACSKAAAPLSSIQADRAAATSPPPPKGAPSGAARTGPPQADQAALPLRAYAYDYAVTAPAGRIRTLLAQDQAACAAGAPNCQVIGAELAADGADDVTAKLTIKAVPTWLEGYEDRLSHEAAAAGGRLARSTTASDDLTRDTADAGAAVRAKTALRDRLQQMLETRSGSLSDLLAVEDKLAGAQSDLDAATSEFAALRERVATSDVTIDYASGGLLAPGGVGAPVASAAAGAMAIASNSAAALIYVAAFLAPWAAVAGVVFWLVRGRRVRARHVAPPPPA